ncbi:tripartite tricarboxylate transporter substrate binding protein [Fictibacillus enclensis]|uniref:tripartite tricarboxylate transporter substrate binding protein n=1 Tax=Fictibacillus enclensis TaxID=1017270 RepID=UPI0024C07718|nr:tripartite tricarboxylate transporter substrate binding protein [Fictibacillus enclensis]WHY70540.1 tripartite tricarboxylate transporter substrate binding protein [Fictibacillus enclensis]
MKKRFLPFLSLTFSAMLLAACGQQGAASTAGKETAGGAGDFPDKPINLIVSFAAGGGTDLGARVLAAEVEEDLGVPVNVINKPGGGGWVGWADLVKAKPDGYTIGYVNTPNLITGYLNPGLNRSETIESFAPICNHITDAGVIAVKADDKRFKTIEDVIEYAKKHETTTTSTGLGSDDHIAALKINEAQGTKFKAVHTGGLAENMANILGGHVDVFFANVGEVANEVDKGEIKILAVLSEERSTYLPDVPTLKEAGYGDIYSWSARGLAAPKGTDPEVLKILESAFEKGINNEKHKAKMDEMGLQIDYKNSADYKEMLKEEEKNVLEVEDLLGWK